MSARGTSRANRVLQDAREYRQERLAMNNPKGWDHVMRTSLRFAETGAYDALPDDDCALAYKVLRRLARLAP